MNRVFVLNSDRKALMPCHPARARRLLKTQRAAIWRHFPFTIILKRQASDTNIQPLEARLDPGSKTTGMALAAFFQRGVEVVFAAHLHHRGAQIKRDLDAHRAIRRSRRFRKNRYRPPRFDNRTRPSGWLPPSLMSRVFNVRTIIKRLISYAPISSIAVETVRFDMQAMERPEIKGVEYQQGELAGYEVREYLLEKWGRQCAYCGAQDTPLQVEHIQPKSRGGTNRISNLTIACCACNTLKSNRTIDDFLKKKPELLKRIKARAKAPLKDAAAVNATRYAIGNMLKSFKLPVSFWSGGRTKFNRQQQNYPKDHWIDAACVGENGLNVILPNEMKPLEIKALGRGNRQVCRVDKYGFPRSKPKSAKMVRGFLTGDVVKLVQPTGKYKGVQNGLLAGVRTDGRFDLKAKPNITSNWKNFTLIQRFDGYGYAVWQHTP